MTEPRDHFVYRVFDAEGRVLYVGCTGNPEVRYKSHMRGDDGGIRGWFGRFAHHWVVTGPLPRSKALAIEEQAIRDLDPLFNTFKTGIPRHLRRRRLEAYYISHGLLRPHSDAWVLQQLERPRRRVAA
jgi:predicted GIY-YIG superfamily endonuclease